MKHARGRLSSCAWPTPVSSWSRCSWAAGGTLFLDEGSSLSLETQAKLLRVLEVVEKDDERGTLLIEEGPRRPEATLPGRSAVLRGEWGEPGEALPKAHGRGPEGVAKHRHEMGRKTSGTVPAVRVDRIPCQNDGLI
jgi:hypothetical protein